jgi:hypothetical protein
MHDKPSGAGDERATTTAEQDLATRRRSYDTSSRSIRRR